MSTLSTVAGIKASLSKMLPVESVSDENVERCEDLFKQLDGCDVTLEILSKSMIGAVVSKFKGHATLGPAAKALVKKWKKVAKEGEDKPAKGSSSSSPTATAASKGGPKPAKAERRDSTTSATAAAEEEWSSLEPARKNICQKLHASLTAAKAELVKSGINASAVDHLIVTRATEIEAAIHKSHRNDKTLYAGKARSLFFNIKKNTKLGGEVIMGQIGAKDLVSMSSEELASDEKRREMEERTQKLMDTKRLDWEQANESKINEMCGIKGELLSASLFTCGRCKSTKTTSTQKQTRSADEPMTVFVLCLNCGKRWKC